MRKKLIEVCESSVSGCSLLFGEACHIMANVYIYINLKSNFMYTFNHFLTIGQLVQFSLPEVYLNKASRFSQFPVLEQDLISPAYAGWLLAVGTELCIPEGQWKKAVPLQQNLWTRTAPKMEADCIVSNYFREVHDKKENEFINSILRECPFKGKNDALVYFINKMDCLICTA